MGESFAKEEERQFEVLSFRVTGEFPLSKEYPDGRMNLKTLKPSPYLGIT